MRILVSKKHFGFWYNGHRDYDASTGRYLQADPVGLLGGLNAYAYATANPVTYIDFLGLEWEYSQGTGTLRHNGQKFANGYAGHGEGVNKPNMQNIPNIGPLPRGIYTIQPQADNPISITKILPGSMRLMPNKNNSMFNRNGFLIHGPHKNDNYNSSNGCIILGRDVRDSIGDFVDGGDNQLRVTE